MNFQNLGLNQSILRALEKNKFQEPTEIQQKCIPVFLNNQNLFGKSSTGTGKTAGFVLPILQKINLKSKKPQALILTPTRELALQILDQVHKFSSMMEYISVAGLIGGVNLSNQIKKVKTAQIVVGTPGRINDHINRKTLKLDGIQTIILDEADEMLKMGFKNEIDSVFEGVGDKTQIGLFSATMNFKTAELANKYMSNYQLVEIKNQMTVNNNIQNSYVITKGYHKEDLLIGLIKKHQMQKFIIFLNTKRDTKNIAHFLATKKIKNQIINGDLKQFQRTRVIKDFKENKFQCLIATDVVARGIHIDNIDYVINFEIPMDDEFFVHRIGRTGRNNQKGSSITFVNSLNLVRQLKNIVQEYNLEISEELILDLGLEKTIIREKFIPKTRKINKPKTRFQKSKQKRTF